MALLNLLQLLPGDDQQTHTDKINFNFDQILSMGGGPPGLQGIQGIQGIPGTQGPRGFDGPAGTPGSRWTVSDVDPVLSSPEPNDGDFWFNTTTLEVFEYHTDSPSGWISVGTLTVTNLFKLGVDNILFTNPSPTRSLVLSQLDYGAGNDSNNTNNYRLKVIGVSGQSLINLGISEDNLTENSEATQARIYMDVDTANTSYKLNILNPSSDIFFGSNGNNFRIVKQISGVSAFEFFNTSFKIQIDANDRVTSFSAASSGVLKYHIGRHNAINSSSDRLFTVVDSAHVGINCDTPVYRVDQIQPGRLLGTASNISTGSNVLKAWRIRTSVKTAPDEYNELKLNVLRNFASGTSALSAEHRFGLGYETSGTSISSHFISFHGGANNLTEEQLTNTASDSRYSLRFGYGDSVNDGYYYGADRNGYSLFGSSAYIKDYNQSDIAYPTGKRLRTRLNVQWDSGTADPTGKTAFGGIHLFGTNDVDRFAGITYGGPAIFANQTTAGIIFQSDSGIPNSGGSGADIHLLTGNYASGAKKRYTVYGDGNHYWWARDSAEHHLNLNITSRYTRFNSYEWTQNKWRNIVFQTGTDSGIDSRAIATANVSSGVVSSISIVNPGVIGAFATAPTIQIIGGGGSGATATATINGSGQINSINITNGGSGYVESPAVVILGGGSDVEYGYVGGGFIGIGDFSGNSNFVLGQPQTKFHVNGAVTIGSRVVIPRYISNFVGNNSFTHGENVIASGDYSAIIGGGNYYKVSGRSSVIIGHSDGPGKIELSADRRVLIATRTSIMPDNLNNAIQPRFKSNSIYGHKDNALTVTISEGNTNGIEIDAKFSASTPVLPAFTPFLYTSDDQLTFGSTIRFVVNELGSIGAMGDVFTTDVSAVSTNAQPVPHVGLGPFGPLASAINARGDITLDGIIDRYIKLASFTYNQAAALPTPGNLFIIGGTISNTGSADVTGSSLVIKGGFANASGGNARGGNIFICGGGAQAGGTATQGNISLGHDGSSRVGNVVVGALPSASTANFDVFGTVSMVGDTTSVSPNTEYLADTDCIINVTLIENPYPGADDAVYQFDTHVYSTSGTTPSVSTLQGRVVMRILWGNNFQSGGQSSVYVKKGSYFKITTFVSYYADSGVPFGTTSTSPQLIYNGDNGRIGNEPQHYKITKQNIGK